jgi:hypothetical protein
VDEEPGIVAGFPELDLDNKLRRFGRTIGGVVFPSTHECEFG